MRISVSLPDELVEEVDSEVSYSNPEKKDRSKVVAIALRYYLENNREAA